MRRARSLAVRASLGVCALGALLEAGCGGEGASVSGGDGGSRVDPDPCSAPRLPARLRRLSRFELDQSIVDLLGLSFHVADSLPPDDVVDHFDGSASALRVGPLLSSRLLAVAERAAADAGDRLPSLSGCAVESDGCALQLITTLGRRAFRRLLTPDEEQRYLALHRQVAALDGFRAGQETVIAALLQSPHFLYRPEIGRPVAGGAFELDDHELAAQLSYFFWGSIPDDALLDAADAGQLHTPEQIESAARRLLASARSQDRLRHFAALWLDVEGVLTAPKLGEADATLTPALRQAMLEEALATFEHAVRTGARVADLLDSGETVASEELARFYGVRGDPLERFLDGTARWSVASVNRGGLLASGALLAAHAHADSASPVARGKLVRERLLCQPLPPPPVGVAVTLPPVVPGQSNRERFTRHMQDPACARCHKLMDPVGFGFERFDAIGRYVERDDSGLIDDTATITDSRQSDGTFAGVAGLARHLAHSPEFADCVATEMALSAFGVGSSDDVACLLASSKQSLRDVDLRPGELLIAMARSRDFRLRAAAP